MDADAPQTVLKGSLAACKSTGSAGAVVGATYAVAKRQSPLVFAVNSSVNSGLAGLTFFALREYVARPALVHTTAPASASMHSHKLLDTALAGAATGGILNAWKRGPPGVLPGIVTAGALCTAAQFLWNELNVARVKFVARHDTHPEPAARSRPFSEALMDGLSVVLPIRKITDEAYLQKLLRERDEVEKNLRLLQDETEDRDVHVKKS